MVMNLTSRLEVEFDGSRARLLAREHILDRRNQEEGSERREGSWGRGG
jgi:hypothetical protein